MTPVSLGLDSILALLLIAALAVGVRLNAKLKTLRESHAGFAKAVGDLDVAAGRAEAGLAALRTATLEAHDALLNRIETARSLASRLERAGEDAGGAAERAEAAAARAQAATAALDRAPPRSEPRNEVRGETKPETRPQTRPSPPRLVASAPAGDDAAAAVLRLIATARDEAGASLATVEPLGALRPAPIAPAPASAAADADAGADRLARFVARRREARAG